MKLLISLSALLLSIILVQMGIDSLRPFETISGQALGFTPIEIGIITSGHFAGFLLGCIFSPSLVQRAGHSRAFAVMVGIAVGIIEVPVVFILSFLFGCSTFPIYSICAAHVSDYIRGSEMLALSASMIFIHTVGRSSRHRLPIY